MVVFHHIGGVDGLGGYAVFGFYILSGYLMTLILHTNYGYSLIGVTKYALNRFLRVFPIYWIACLASVTLCLWLGEAFTMQFHSRIFLPDNTLSVFQNVFIIFEQASSPRLTPPAWALTVEIFFYICIGLGISRTKNSTVIWFFISIVYTVVVNVMAFEWRYKYFVIPAASLPFATGAMIYHYKDELRFLVNALKNQHALSLLFMTVIANYFISRQIGVMNSYGFYLNFILNSLLVLLLTEHKFMPFVSAKLDKRLGDFSYPIYLIHYQVGLLLLGLGVGLDRGNPLFALVSLPIIFFLAWMLTRFLERPIEALRLSVKSRYAGSPIIGKGIEQG